MSHASAMAYCTSLDTRAHLAEIKTSNIQEFLEGLQDLKSYLYWWLGGSDGAEV